MKLAGQYIVVFKQGAGSASAAAAALSTHVSSQLAAAGSMYAASVSTLQIFHTLGDFPTPGGPANTATAPAAGAVRAATSHDSPSHAAAATQSITTGLQGVVMRIQHPEALEVVKTASTVQAVVPDRPIAAQQEPIPACIQPQQLSKGVLPSLVAKTFRWRGCKTTATGACALLEASCRTWGHSSSVSSAVLHQHSRVTSSPISAALQPQGHVCSVLAEQYAACQQYVFVAINSTHTGSNY